MAKSIFSRSNLPSSNFNLAESKKRKKDSGTEKPRTVSSKVNKVIPNERLIQVKPKSQNHIEPKPFKSCVSHHSKLAQSPTTSHVESKKKAILNSSTQSQTSIFPSAPNSEGDQSNITTEVRPSLPPLNTQSNDLDSDNLVILPSSYESFASQLHDELLTNSNHEVPANQRNSTPCDPIAFPLNPIFSPSLFGDQYLFFHGLHCHPTLPRLPDPNSCSLSTDSSSIFPSFEASESFLYESTQPKNSMRYQSKICFSSTMPGTFGNR